MTITNRFAARVAAFALAVTAVLGVKAGLYRARALESEQALRYSYYRAVQDLAASTDSINSTLEKELYAGTPLMHSELSSQLSDYASNAKAALTQLPIESMGLSNTYKFLSQVGSFSQALSKKLARGEKLTDKEYQSLSALHEYSQTLSDTLWEIGDKVSTGELVTVAGDEQNAALLSESGSFDDYESSFENYPKLIYDGPFSDNILDKEPQLLKGLAEVDEKKALQKCMLVTGLNVGDLPNMSEEYGKMPSYRFYDDNGSICCAVTKQGGFVSYFLKTRRVNSTDISAEQAIDFAQRFLDTLGMVDMESTYYETYDNVCTVNFACTKNNIIMYTDLVKVQVDMSNGDIVGYDGRGYIVNHTERDKGEGVISAKRAEKEVSPVLDIGSHRLCYIPTPGGSEVLCYEFSCLSSSGRRVLVYINAKTAAEEQILMLEESESGVLTV